MKKTLFVFLITCAGLGKLCGQTPVPVYEEPRHKPIFLNEYVRIIRATIKDQDTSLFHIHTTPSAFVFVKPAHYDNQVMGENWTTPNYAKGYAWYSSFSAGPSTHRVAAHPQSEVFAYDVELLNRYNKDDKKWQPLSSDTIFIADKAAGYRIVLNKEKPRFEITSRGPIVAILLSGNEVEIVTAENKPIFIKETAYAYLDDKKKHVIKHKGDIPVEIILFEVR
jgi:hypothetical protein